MSPSVALPVLTMLLMNPEVSVKDVILLQMVARRTDGGDGGPYAGDPPAGGELRHGVHCGVRRRRLLTHHHLQNQL